MRRGAVAACLAAAILSGCDASRPAGETGEWAKDIAHIDCCARTVLRAPNGTKTLIFTPDDRQETVSVRLSAGWLRQYPIATVDTAMASWSPDSNAFFISDGEGSGPSSTFHLFRAPDDGGPSEMRQAGPAAIAAYRAHVACPATALDPEVWGLGWDRTGKQAYVLVQSSIHQPCGQSDRYMVMTIDADTGALVARYDTAEAAAKFADLIPANVLGRDATRP